MLTLMVRVRIPPIFSTFTPLSTYDTTVDHDWNMHITKAEIKDVNDYPQIFPNNLNGQDEPGLNKGKDYNTSQILGDLTEGGKQGSVNNDWSITHISASLTGSGNMSKTIRLDKDGTPDYSKTAETWIYKNDQKYWADVMLSPTPIKTNSFSICDTFSSSNLSYGQQYDASRKPVVQWWDSTSKKYIDRSYKIYYGQNGFGGSVSNNNQFNDACGTEKDTVWSTTPTAKTNTIKVVIDGEQDWAVDNQYAGRITLPFKPFEIYTDNNSVHTLNDTVALSNGGGNNSWVGTSGANIKVGVPDYGWGGRLETKNIYAGATATGLPTNGILANFGYQDMTEPEVFKSKITLTIDSCISNFVIPQAFKDLYDYTITPADFGPDGLACTDDDVSDWKITTGEIKKPVKNIQTPGDKYMWVTGNELSANNNNWFFTVPAYVKGGTTIPIRSNLQLTNIKEKDTTDNIGGTDLIVGAASTVGQAKLTTTPVKQVGEDVNWTLTWFNTSDNNVGKGEFIDVLPYNGDNRGTKMKGKLTNIRLENLPKTSGATYYVTTAAPSTVIANVDDASNKEGGSTKWCVYTDKTCIGNSEITAIRMVQDKLDSGYIGGVKVIANTVGNADNDVLENNLGVGKVEGFALTIPTTSNIESTLYDTILSGNVYWDANNNSTMDADEKRRFQGAKIQVTDNSGKVVKEVISASDGTWSANNIPLGDYKVQIVDRGGNILSKWNQTEGATPTNVTLTIVNKTKENINYGFYAKVNPGIKIVKTAEGYSNGGNVITGSSVTWNYTVTNTGDTTINGIKVTDSKGVQVTCPKSTLEVGESMVCKGTGVVNVA